MIYILKTPLSPVNGEKEEKHFHGNGHLCTSTCTTLIILLDSVAKKPHLQLISGSILGMKVLFFSFILQLAIIMNNEAFAFSNVTIYRMQAFMDELEVSLFTVLEILKGSLRSV